MLFFTSYDIIMSFGLIYSVLLKTCNENTYVGQIAITHIYYIIYFLLNAIAIGTLFSMLSKQTNTQSTM